MTYIRKGYCEFVPTSFMFAITLYTFLVLMVGRDVYVH